MIEDPGVLLRILTSLGDRDVVFIDEIHALPKRVMESLYEAMEDGRISLSVTDGHASKALQILLPRFTLVGATTEIGRLPDPFVSRFPIREHLAAYGEEDLAAIVTRAAARDGIGVDEAAARGIASVSRGTARQAISLFRRIRNEALAGDFERIDVEAVARGLEGAGIDRQGLNSLERTAFEALRRHDGPMGLGRWAAASGIAASTIRQICEPALLQLGLIAVTPRGRVATRAQLRAVARDGLRYEDPTDLGAGGFLCRERAVS